MVNMGAKVGFTVIVELDVALGNRMLLETGEMAGRDARQE